jgi:hypothetical protein
MTAIAQDGAAFPFELIDVHGAHTAGASLFAGPRKTFGTQAFEIERAERREAYRFETCHLLS